MTIGRERRTEEDARRIKYYSKRRILEEQESLETRKMVGKGEGNFTLAIK